MNEAAALLVLHLLASAFMAGLAWFVQLVHYPLMALVGEQKWVEYEGRHGRRTSAIVMPAMLIEAATAVWLVLAPPLATSRGLALLGVGLLAVVWLSTFLVQVPLHARLERGFDARAHARLVTSSWIRTAGWSLRALVAAWLVLVAA